MGEVKVFGHGRVQIPKAVRTSLDLEDGDNLWWLKDDDGKIYVEKVRPKR